MISAGLLSMFVVDLTSFRDLNHFFPRPNSSSDLNVGLSCSGYLSIPGIHKTKKLPFVINTNTIKFL